MLIRLEDEANNLMQQIAKQGETSAALTKLIDALKTQVALTKEEAGLKLMEETNKRIECSKNFQSTMTELSDLVGSHTDHNSRLKNENEKLTSKFSELLAQFEEREKRNSAFRIEADLQMKLFEAKLAKANIEKAEINADFTKERLGMHKELLESKKENADLFQQNKELTEQIEVYVKQYEELQKGIGEKNDGFKHFKVEMERLGKKLRAFERDTSDWKDKFETSNEQVKKMNALQLEKDKELQSAKKKLAAMEKLNRALQDERTELTKKIAAKE